MGLLRPLSALTRWASGLPRRGAAFLYWMVQHPWRTLATGALVGVIALFATQAGLQLYATYHFRAGRQAVDRYHNHDAEKHLTECLRVWPRDAATLLLAARTARRLGYFEAAEQLLEKAQSGRPPSDDLVLERALLRAERGEVEVVAKFGRAQVEANDPAAPLLLEAMAHGYIRLYQYRSAEFCLRRWLEREPDNPMALYLRAIMHQQRENRFEALADFRRVVEVDPDFEEARYQVVSLMLDLAQATEALPYLKHLEERQPDNPQLQVYLARCAKQLGQTAEAERRLDAVLARNPQFGPALLERGQLAMQLQQPEAAEGWLREAVVREAGSYQAHYQLYLCLRERHKTEEAREEEQRLKQIAQDITHIQDIVRHQLQERPHDAALQYETGMILLRAGGIEEGVRWLQSAVKEDPHYAPAHTALASYYQRIGQPGRAAQHRELAKAAEAETK